MTSKELVNYLLITGKLEPYYLEKALEIADKNINIAKFYTKLVNVGMTPELAIETMWNVIKYTTDKKKIDLVCNRLELMGYTFSREITIGVWVQLIYRVLDDLKLKKEDKIEQKLNDKLEFNFYSQSQLKKKITLGRKEYRIVNDSILDNDRKPVYTNVMYIAIKDKDNYEVYSDFDNNRFNEDKHRLKIGIT